MTATAGTPPETKTAAGGLHIVNPDPRYARAKLVEPTTLGYIYVAAEVHPRPLPFWPNSREKSAFLARLKQLTRQLEQLDAVRRVTVFDAIAIPPFNRFPYIRERKDSIHLARFDVVVLIEASSPAAARELQTAPAYLALMQTLRSKARDVHAIVARNAKRIGDVDHTRNGTFLFNHFVADDAGVMLELWDYLAGWYTAETGLDNSLLLVPLEGERSDYLAINHAVWRAQPLRVMWRQLTKPSFWSYVLANLKANRAGSMPVLYRRA